MNATLKLPACAALTTMALVLAVFAAPAAAQRAKNGKPTEPVYAGVIVKYKSASARATATNATTLKSAEDRARVKFGAARAGAMDTAVYHFAKAMPAAEARAAAARIALDPNVEYAVPDQVMHALQTTPNDTDYAAMQWNLQTATGTGGIVGSANLPLAWQRTTGSNTVIVAVVDTGIRPGHPDLAGRVVPGYDFISSDTFAALGYPANWNAGDGNGRDSDATDPGDYVDDTLLAMLPANSGVTTHPSSWHGTHVAGIIGAASNNAQGIAGIDWAARILPVRVLGRDGGSTSDIVDGIAWAAGLSVPGAPANPNPARVINLSLGGPGECSAAFLDVITRVRAAGAIVVAAAGNEASSTVGQPANCNGVIAVTAHARDGDNASYSNYGAPVAISAPGGGCGTFSLLDRDATQDYFDNTCSDCHNNSGGIPALQQQIDARAPMGLTFAKARAALEAALTGKDLDGVATGMGGLSVSAQQRNDLAALIANTFCSGPSDGVYSTLNLGITEPDQEGYAAYAGTSMATPHVSGVAALLLSLSPKLSSDEVKSVLQTTARPHPAGTYCAQVKGVCGTGLLDAAGAVDHVVNNRPTVTAAIQGSSGTGVAPSASFTLVGTVKTVGGRAATTMTWRQTSGPTVSLSTTSGGSTTIKAPSSGKLGFEFVATDSLGYSATATATVVVNSPPVLQPIAAVSTTKGQPVSGSVRATDPDGDAITYVVINAPDGFNLNAGTGAWSWTPSSSGDYTLAIMPTDAYGNGTPVTLQISVAKGSGEGGGGALPAWIALLLVLALCGTHGRRTPLS